MEGNGCEEDFAGFGFGSTGAFAGSPSLTGFDSIKAFDFASSSRSKAARASSSEKPSSSGHIVPVKRYL